MQGSNWGGAAAKKIRGGGKITRNTRESANQRNSLRPQRTLAHAALSRRGVRPMSAVTAICRKRPCQSEPRSPKRIWQRNGGKGMRTKNSTFPFLCLHSFASIPLPTTPLPRSRAPSYVVQWEFSHVLFSRVIGTTNLHNRLSGFSVVRACHAPPPKPLKRLPDSPPRQHPAEAGC